MSVNKQGIWTAGEIVESEGANILLNTEKYTKNSPLTLSGTSGDIIRVTDMYNRVAPGETYYLTCKTDSEWADEHGYTESRKGKVTIWLYLINTYDPNNYGYDYPVNFNANSSNKVKDGIWKYTIPDGYNMARVRFNTYSDGANSVTCKFWDVRLIPEKYYVPSTPENSVSLHIGKDYISAGEIYEI